MLQVNVRRTHVKAPQVRQRRSFFNMLRNDFRND
jgi:hypothetical protein